LRERCFDDVSLQIRALLSKEADKRVDQQETKPAYGNNKAQKGKKAESLRSWWWWNGRGPIEAESHLGVMTFLALNTILSYRKKIVGKEHRNTNARRADFREG
jgi:hypothetical protein